MSPHLLSAKFHPPPVVQDLVQRPHLLGRLDASLHQKLTLLCTPAGFGKTTLLCQWAAQLQAPVAWLLLDRNDNTPALFFEYLIAAFQTVCPNLGKTIEPAPNALAASYDVVSIALLNEIAALSSPLVLILEDYHLIENPQIHASMAYWLENLPPQLHLILATRAEPRLPLARLRTRGQLLELRMEDLRFTLSDTLTFFQYAQQNHKGRLTREQVIALYNCTEGWIDGLHMAALALQPLAPKQYEVFIAEFVRGNHYTVEYFAEEVWSRQPEPLQHFLLQTATVERLTGSLCLALTKDAQATICLKQMEKSDLFISAVEGQREWYRYHPLFAKFLLQRLHQLTPAQLPELHRRASDWFEEHGYLTEAVQHALSAQDWERALHLMENNAQAMVIESRLATISDSIKALSHAAEKPIAPTDAAPYTDVEQILAQLPENYQDYPEINLVTMGRIYLLLGQAKLAEETMAGIDLTQPEYNRNLTTIALLGSLGEMRMMQGKLHMAAATFQPFLAWATEQLPETVCYKFLEGLCHLYYEWNMLDEAQSILDHCLPQTTDEQQWSPAFINCYLLQVKVLWAEGRSNLAEQTMEHALILAHMAENLLYLSQVKAQQAQLWLHQGKVQAASAWLTASGLQPDDAVAYSCLVEYLTLARVLIASGKAEQAAPLLTRMLESAEATGRAGDVIKILALRALAYQASNMQTQAFADIANALCQAERERYIRTFVDHGAPMAKLIRYAASQGVTIFYCKTILSALANPESAGSDPHFAPSQTVSTRPQLIEPLSERELEVLHLVATGQSNREIGAALFIAPTTVKKHLSNIFGKLGARNRTEAAARARQLELI
ncbi:MAG: LuxR C-terminal-related transcriptional regulator [Caldilineaceae bacterium]